MAHAPLIVDVPWRSQKQLRSFAYTEHFHKTFIKAGATRRSASSSSLVRLGSDRGEGSDGESVSDTFVGPHMKELHVRTVAGPLCSVRLHSHATVAEAKRALARRVNIPAQQLKILRTEAAPPDATAADSAEPELVEPGEREALKDCGAWNGESMLLTTKERTPLEVALAELLMRTAEVAAEVRISKNQSRGARRRSGSPGKVRHQQLPGPPETLPDAGRELDYSKAFAMPVLYQTVEIDQSGVARTGMSTEIKGMYYVGLGLTINSSTLEVEEVREGLISKWNAAHPAAPITVGDRLIDVNGVNDPTLILRKELIKKQRIKLALARLNTLPLPTQIAWVPEPVVPPGCTEIVLFVDALRSTTPAPEEEQQEEVGEAVEDPLSATSGSTARTYGRRPAEFRLQWIAGQSQSSVDVGNAAVAAAPKANGEAISPDADTAERESGYWLARMQRASTDFPH